MLQTEGIEYAKFNIEIRHDIFEEVQIVQCRYTIELAEKVGRLARDQAVTESFIGFSNILLWFPNYV